MHARNEEFLHTSRVTRPRVWTGLLLNESYRIGSLIEQGATTELYDGIEVSTGEPVALKILLPQLAADAKTRTLFLEEARVLTRLSQPGLHRYRSCARDPQSDLTYIVTDVVGTRLSFRSGARRLSQQDIVDFTKRIALALGAAHRAGLVHRNLRPHAIALPDGRVADAVVTDFDLIKAAHSGRNRDFDSEMLDRAFCAPEQLSGADAADAIGPWTDVYSLALVVLAAIGAKPSEGEPADVSPLPRKLQPVFERMLEPTPARRLQSMDDVVKQLALIAGAAPLRDLLERAPSVSLPRFRRRTAATPPVRPVVEALAKPLPPLAAAPMLPSKKAPLPDAPLPAKKIPLATFHEARAPATRLDVAGRAVLATAVLFLAATPWVIQTSLPSAPADASTVMPDVPVQRTAAQTDQPANTSAALSKGQVYGGDNAYSRVTLRIHRSTRVTVHSRGGRLIFSRALQPGDTYRAPSLPDLTITADDAGAVEIVSNGASSGFVGENGVPIARAPLNRLASLAPREPARRAPARIAPPADKAIAVQDAAPAPIEEASAIIEPPETTEALPVEPSAPDATVATPIVPPRLAEMRDIPLETVPVSIPDISLPQQVVVPAPEPEAEAGVRRRPILDLIIPWRR